MTTTETTTPAARERASLDVGARDHTTELAERLERAEAELAAYRRWPTDPERDEALIAELADACSNVVSIASGKGGSSKTAIAASIASIAASSGYQVLLVELDPTGAIRQEFGMLGDSDDGAALADALVGGPTPKPMQARENLDVILCGPLFDDAVDEFRFAIKAGEAAATLRLRACFAELAEDYDLVLFDHPPNDVVIQRLGLAASGFYVCPTRCDDASIDNLGPTIAAANDLRDRLVPNLRRLGVVLCAVPGSRQEARARAVLAEIGLDGDDVFATSIRNAQGTVTNRRTVGMTAGEYVNEARARKGHRIAMLRSGQRASGRGDVDFSDLRTAEHLLTDYKQLTVEILERIHAATGDDSEAGN